MYTKFSGNVKEEFSIPPVQTMNIYSYYEWRNFNVIFTRV